jgi:hypothetical protein
VHALERTHALKSGAEDLEHTEDPQTYRVHSFVIRELLANAGAAVDGGLPPGRWYRSASTVSGFSDEARAVTQPRSGPSRV